MLCCFPRPIPPPVVSSHPVDECPSHPLECASHPIDCFSHPLLDDFDEDDYDSSPEEEEEASMTEVEHGGQLATLRGTLHLSSVLLWPTPFSFAQSLAFPFASFTCPLSLSMDIYPFCLSMMACLVFRLSGWAPPFCLSKPFSPYILPFPFPLSPSSSRFPLEVFCPFPGVSL